MKKYFIILFTSLFLGASIFSCEKWLDVDSNTRVVQESLFSQPSGMRSALNGIYRLLGSSELYGKNLTWGLTSVLSRDYNVNTLPHSLRYLIYEGSYEVDYGPENIDPVWNKGYNLVANINNLLQAVEAKDTTFFEYTTVERNLFMGELKGLRGMIHLDLLRLFAPAPIINDNGSYIPYVDKYPEHQPKIITNKQVMERIIEDLEYAKKTLVYHDTLYNTYASSSVSSRIEANNTLVKGGLFFHARSVRLSYFAASALLARAYLYAGDKENAYKHAEDMYQYASRRKWFTFTSEGNMTGSGQVNNIYRKMYEDIILAAVNSKMYDIYNDTFASGAGFYLNRDIINEIYKGDVDDFRMTTLIETDGRSRRWVRPVPTSENDYWANMVINWQGPLAPIIRTSEVIYIMCECLADTDLPKAITLLENVRTVRGAKTKISADVTKEQFLEILRREIIKESATEGQTFFMYKRLNLPIYNGTQPEITMGKLFVLPKPLNETSYSTL